MRPDDLVRLRHILDAAREACGFILWKTTQEDLPFLVAKLEPFVPREEE
jgi:hypothetical protein